MEKCKGYLTLKTQLAAEAEDNEKKDSVQENTKYDYFTESQDDFLKRRDRFSVN